MRVEAGSKAERRRVVGLGFVAGRAKSQVPTDHYMPNEFGARRRPGSHRCEDEPLPAEQIRRSWEAGEYAAIGPVVGLVVWAEQVVERDPHRSEGRPLHREPERRAVGGRAGRGSRGWS